jgi:hypothetical protein
MFCPKCKSEFVEGITRCPDCDTNLVEQLPAEKSPQPNNTEWPEYEDWVMVYYPSGAQELAMIKMVLEREDIPYFIGNDNVRRSSLYTPVNLAFELWVPREFMEQTLQLLRDELRVI